MAEPMKALSQLKMQRTALRSGFTRSAKNLDSLLEESTNADQIEVALERLTEKKEQLRSTQEEYLRLMSTSCTQEKYDEEFSASEEYYDRFAELKLCTTKTLKYASSTSETSKGSFYRLPEIELMKFDGDPRNWLPFWNQFEKIHLDPRMDKRDKFSYLLQSMAANSKPRSILESFPASSENYQSAIDHLKERFGNEGMLIQIHIRDLLKLVTSDKTKTDLGSLYDKLMTHLRSLTALGLTQDKFADFLYPLIESAIPPSLLLIYERQKPHMNSEGKSDLDLIIQFLKAEVESQSKLKLAKDFSVNNSVCKNSVSYCKNNEDLPPTSHELLTSNKSEFPVNYVGVTKKFNLCIFCDSKCHSSESCNSVSSMTLEKKKGLVKQKNACFVCLKTYPPHRANRCRSQNRCLICNNRHFVILCPDLPIKEVDGNTRSKTSTLNNQLQLSDVLLQTLIVRVSNGQRSMLVRAIIDQGSQRSYIKNDLAKILNCKTETEVRLKQALFGGIETSEKVHKVYNVGISSVDKDYHCKVQVIGQTRICSAINRIPYGSWVRELERLGIHLTDLECENMKVDREIKLLIGADLAGSILTGKLFNLRAGPTVVGTKLGFCVLGKFSSGVARREPSEATLLVSLLVKDTDVSNLWKLDLLGISESVMSQTKLELEEETLKYFESTISVNSEGRYEVALPWVLDKKLLPDNRNIAERCAFSTKRKLISSGNYDIYGEVFKTWLDLGIVEIVKGNLHGHYLPHRPVFKEESTTKVRPVFNASAHVTGSPSLNDCLAKGPNMIEIIPTLLNRFRKNFVGVVSDIEKAFLQISVRKEDRDFLGFLWFKEDTGDLQVYRHKRVVFGVSSSPFLLTATMQYHLDRVPNDLRPTAEILKTAFYVDNCLASLSTELEMKKFILESQTIMNAGHFNLRGWKCNVPFLVEDGTSNDCNQVLGLEWETGSDTLSYKVKEFTGDMTVTKRTILSIAHQVFDVIGYTAPVMLIPKLILQEAWSSKLTWDQELPECLSKRFKTWYKKLSLISEIKIPRWLGISEAVGISLHLFCDASQLAYGACVFIRTESEGRVTLRLVNARSRVAPLKPTTIPRLELLACNIGARLMVSVQKDLNLVEAEFYCWTDSTTALCWIREDKLWGTYVQNRVNEIRKLTAISHWRHVPGSQNPADIVSRGCSPAQLVQVRWWEGPNWLREHEGAWPDSSEEPDGNLVDAERRKTVITSLSSDCESFYSYFSSWKRIVRMIAWMLRFLFNCKSKLKNFDSNLSLAEIQKAELSLAFLVQRESFEGLKDKRIKSLNPFLDDFGLLRVKTNLVYREDHHNFKFPIILPSSHSVVQSLIMHVHFDLMHAGTSMIMSHLRENYWILKSRKTIKNCINNCVKCKRFKAKPCETVPGILPSDRVRDAAVFEVTGCDYAGPLYLRDGKKAYIVLFTCAVYRAIHLELVTSLSTDAFFQALRRFIARRGRPATIYSDNGTNFVGAEKALLTVDWDSLRGKALEQKIEWKFNPPSAAWWGGWWERLVQVVKVILRKVLGKASLDYEELETVLCDCERTINTRPLTFVSEDPYDPSPLTPEMFLREIPQSGVIDLDSIDKSVLRKRVKYLQKVRESFRSRFRLEYLGQLKQQTIKKFKIEPLKVGEIVLIEDNNKKRIYWNLARVIKLFPGRDGNVRLALVQTANSEFMRPVQRLFRLELEGSFQRGSPSAEVTTSSGRVVRTVI